MGKIFRHSRLNGTHHGLLAKNVRLYLNPTTIKFEPVSFDGHQGTGNDQLKKNFIILDLLFKDTDVVEIISVMKENGFTSSLKIQMALTKWNL